MTRQLSAQAIQSAYAQQTSEAWIVLLTIDGSTFIEPMRFSSDPFQLLPGAGVRGIISRGEEYIYMPFAVSLASQDDSGIARAMITVDNIDRQMVHAVRSATSALSITIEIVLASSPDVIEVSQPNFLLSRVTYDALTITGDISMEYLDLEPYPSKRMTPSYFPGLF